MIGSENLSGQATNMLGGNMDALNLFLEKMAGYIWSEYLVFLLLGTGLLLTISLGFIQFRGLGHAFKVIRGKFDEPGAPGQITHFQALTTALSATVGLGNIAGVAIAIKIGGPGATFWMIVTGLIGMATKYAECTLSVMFRTIDNDGAVHGGPMYYILRGLGKKWKPLAVFFSIATLCATFGAANMFQTNQVAAVMNNSFNIPPAVSGVVLALLTAIVILGGIQRIGKVTEKLIPIMGGLYLIGSLVVIFSHMGEIPALFGQIFAGAFGGAAAAGGFAGATFRQVFIQGVRRACFSNEAGLGTAPIAHAAAKTREPVREGIVALLEPFIDTVVICTMTALVILISGEWTSDLTGVELTAAAFDSAIPGFGKYFIPIAVFMFAYSTLVSWSYYGETALEFLNAKKYLILYKIIFCVVAFLGSIWSIAPVLNFSDSMLGLMIFPNLIAVLILFPTLHHATRDYFSRLKKGHFK